ncbi:hypothetical protein D9M68_851440 [compost metagenome]
MFLVVAFDRVGVTHQHHRGGGVALAEGFHHRDDLGQANAQRQCAVARALDHRTVGRWVRKRHAEFDDVGTGLDHAVHQIGCDVGIGETGGDEGDQCLAVLRLEVGKGFFDAAHLVTLMVAVASPPLTDCPRQLGRQ